MKMFQQIILFIFCLFLIIGCSSKNVSNNNGESGSDQKDQLLGLWKGDWMYGFEYDKNSNFVLTEGFSRFAADFDFRDSIVLTLEYPFLYFGDQKYHITGDFITIENHKQTRFKINGDTLFLPLDIGQVPIKLITFIRSKPDYEIIEKLKKTGVNTVSLSGTWDYDNYVNKLYDLPTSKLKLIKSIRVFNDSIEFNGQQSVLEITDCKFTMDQTEYDIVSLSEEKLYLKPTSAILATGGLIEYTRR
jgi:hypothetical protein